MSEIPQFDKYYRQVPVEPTPAMLEAAGHACDGLNLSKMTRIQRSVFKAAKRWAAMLNAAPQGLETREPDHTPTTPAVAAPRHPSYEEQMRALEELKTDPEILAKLAAATGKVNLREVLKVQEHDGVYHLSAAEVPGLHVCGRSLGDVLADALPVWRKLYEVAPQQVPPPPAVSSSTGAPEPAVFELPHLDGKTPCTDHLTGEKLGRLTRLSPNFDYAQAIIEHAKAFERLFWRERKSNSGLMTLLAEARAEHSANRPLRREALQWAVEEITFHSPGLIMYPELPNNKLLDELKAMLSEYVNEKNS